MPINHGVIKPLPRSQVPHWFGRRTNSSNRITVTVPILGRVYIHKQIAGPLTEVLRAVVTNGKSALVDRSDYGGCYNNRQTRRGGSWSPHAWAIAVDLNVHHFADGHGGDEKRGRTNYKCSSSDIAPSLKTLAPFFNAYGFTWGGHWSSPRDPMHFEATELTVKIAEGGLSDEEEDIINQARASIGISQPDGLKVLLLPGSEVIPCRPKIEDGVCRVDLRPLAETLGFEVITDHLAEQKKIYLRKQKGGDTDA